MKKDDLIAQIERNKTSNWEDLDPQRKAFALNYVIIYDHRHSAKLAGFSPDSGLRLLREPLLSAYIANLQEEDYITNLITEDFIRVQFLNLIPMLSGQVEVPIVNKDGYSSNVKKFFPGELVSVLKELAKSTKFYENGSDNMDSAANTLSEAFIEAVKQSRQDEE